MGVTRSTSPVHASLLGWSVGGVESATLREDRGSLATRVVSASANAGPRVTPGGPGSPSCPCARECREPLVDLSAVFPAHGAFLSVVRYPWVARGRPPSIDWATPLR